MTTTLLSKMMHNGNRLRSFRFPFSICSSAVAVLAVLAPLVASAILPFGYTQHAFIQGDGSSGYILTDIVPNPNADTINAEFTLTRSGNQEIWCARKAANDKTWSFYYTPSKFRFDYYDAYTAYFDEETYTAGDTISVTAANNVCTVTKNGTSRTAQYTAQSNFTATGGPLMFFSLGTWNGSSYNPSFNHCSDAKLYSFTITRGGNVIHDFVPAVRDSDGKCGLYDTVGGTFYPGTGTFTMGASIESGILTISSSAEASGLTPSPACGDLAGLAPGATVSVSCPAVWTNATTDTSAACTGWKLYDKGGNELASGPETSFTYTHPTPAGYRRLEWQIGVEYKMTATADAGGTVSPAEQWVADGVTATVTATPDAGKAFSKWTGDVPAGVSATSSNLSFVADQPRAFTASFCALEDAYAIDLTDGDVTVEVAAGCVHTVTAVTGNSSANLTVVGGGTLILPSGNLSSSFANLVIDGVMVQVSAENQLGGGTVTLLNGGGIRTTAAFTLAARKIIIAAGSTGILEAVGGTLVVKPAFLSAASATLVKRGTSRLEMQGTSFEVAKHGDWWVIDEGQIFLNGTFSSGKASGIEIHEAGTLLVSSGDQQHVLGDVRMRGGMLRHTVGFGNMNKNLLFITTDLGKLTLGKVTAVPSRDGSHAYISTGFFASGGRSIFDIEEGAVLDLESSLRPSGRATRSLLKTGGGTLRLKMSPFTYGGIEVAGGTLALAGHNVRIARGVPLHVADGARLVLEDGAALDQVPDVPSSLLSEAAVWLDATQLRGLVDGSGLTYMPNFGTAGGVFEGQGGNVPVYRPSALNGMPAMDNTVASGTTHCGLKLVGAYSNTGAELSTYVVASGVGSTKFSFSNGYYGKESSPFSFGTSRGADSAAGGFRYEYTSKTAFNVYFAGVNNAASKVTVTDAPALDSGIFLSSTRRDATSAEFRQYWGDGADDLLYEKTGTFPNYDIANMGLFLRIGNASGEISVHTWPGIIGELLVFSRKLTATEDEAVRGYLAKKWFGSTREWAALPADAASLPVTVEAGATASLCFDKDADAPQFTIVKEGAGELVDFSATPGGMALDVREGRAAFAPAGPARSAAALWLDAADPASLTTNASGAVLSVRNKGWAQGEFLPRDDSGARTSSPMAGEINGRTAIVFDGNDFLRTRAYTNETPRKIYIYLVRQRDAYVANAGLFAHVNSATIATAADSAAAGVALVYESGDKTLRFDYGNNDFTFTTVGANGVTDIDFFHVGGCLACGGDLGAANGVTSLNTLGRGQRPSDNDILRTTNDLFHIGSRLGAGDAMNNYMKGRIGELLVFEEPLNIWQEEELVGYLQKKWMNVGDGSATPPRWLANPGLEVVTGDKLAVRQAEDTELGQDGATVSLSSYEAEGVVAWTREAAMDGALFSVTGDVDFAGPVSLTLNPFPHRGDSQTLATYGGECTGFDPDWTCAGEGMRGNPKVRHLSAEKRILLDFVAPATILFVQ